MQVKGRVAYCLVSLKNKFGVTSEGHIDLIISRQDLASYAGTTYETVFRILNEFTQDSIVATNSKTITILNETALINLAKDEDS